MASLVDTMAQGSTTACVVTVDTQSVRHALPLHRICLSRIPPSLPPSAPLSASPPLPPSLPLFLSLSRLPSLAISTSWHCGHPVGVPWSVSLARARMHAHAHAHIQPMRSLSPSLSSAARVTTVDTRSARHALPHVSTRTHARTRAHTYDPRKGRVICLGRTPVTRLESPLFRV